jgi:multiple sugar transport system ATP-binding protein
MTEVKIESLTKQYGNLLAVQEMSWLALNGEVTVLFGPSGAGKTTTLKLIAGLEQPDEGSIFFDDRLMTEVDTSDRDVAMAFENYALYPHLTVFENIAFPMRVPLRSKQLTKEGIKKRVIEISEVLQIEELLERTPRQLSGGQRQRVALGRCLIRNPAVCLLDEPIAHLDAKLRHRMYAEIKRLQRERGTTTIYATPAQSEAMAMADKVVILFDGVVQQVATPREMYECPANVAIAKFGGEQPMNIISAEIIQEGESAELIVGGVRVRMPITLKTITQNSDVFPSFLLGLRPPDIEFSVTRIDGALPVDLYTVEPLGRTVRATVRLGDNLLEGSIKEDVMVKINDTVWMSLDDTPLYIFSEDTSQLIATVGKKDNKQVLTI